jgi:thiol:disulfide interchange protein DsbD
MIRTLLTLVRRLFPAPAHPARRLLAHGLLACGLAASPVLVADDFLPPTEAFKYDTRVEDGRLTVTYDITPGYYLYQGRLAFESATPGVTVGPPDFPAGEDHEDDYFGRQVIYRDAVAIPMPVSFDGPPGPFELKLKLQGCADAGLCYPPLTWTASATPAATSAATSVAAIAGASGSSGVAGDPALAPATAGPEVAPAEKGFSLKRLFGGGPKVDGDFLPVDEAFVFSVTSSSPDRITLRWDIADEYYLYRDKVKVTVDGVDATLGAPRMPDGKVTHDEYFGEQVVYYDQLIAQVPVSAPPGTRALPIAVSYQGCADAGLCYPPTTKRVTVELGSATAAMTGSAAAAPESRSSSGPSMS